MHRSIAACLAIVMLAACGPMPEPSEAGPRPVAEERAEPVPTEPIDTVAEEPEQPAEKVAEAPIDLPNARVFEDMLLGGQPTLEQINEAKELGYKSILSIQLGDEEGAQALGPHTAGLEMRYVRFAISEKTDLTEAKAWEFAATLGTLEPPIIVHDAAGRRVGAMFALKAFFVDGLSAEEAYEIGVRAGMSDLGPTVKKLLASNDP